jgi:hypothetical protein
MRALGGRPVGPFCRKGPWTRLAHRNGKVPLGKRDLLGEDLRIDHVFGALAAEEGGGLTGYAGP